MMLNKCFLFVSIIAMLGLALSSCGKTKKQENHQSPIAISNIDSSATGKEKYADLQYIEDFFDFGSLIQGEVVSTTFRFKNAGTIPLVIKHLIPSCGCTKTSVSKEVLAPGEEAILEVTFDSAGWRGLQYKSVTLRTNGIIAEKSVTIKANVVVK
jgi:hypothetical protein